jgi:hypothetical protein
MSATISDFREKAIPQRRREISLLPGAGSGMLGG